MARPKGSNNVITKELRLVLKDVILRELEQLSERMDKLTDADRLAVLVKLMPYALPKVDAVHVAYGESSIDW